MAPAKISEEASCSVIHLQGSFASQREGWRNRGLRVLTRVYMYTPRAVYGVHTRGHGVHGGAHTLLPCLGALPCPGAQPRLLGPQNPGLLPSCLAVQVVPRGQDGHSQPLALCRELGQLSPWGCTVLAEPVPW